MTRKYYTTYISELQTTFGNSDEMVGGLFDSNVKIIKCENNLFYIEQYFGIANGRQAKIHTSLLPKLIELEYLFFQLAVRFDMLAEKIYKFCKKKMY